MRIVMLNHPGGEIGWSAKKIHIGFRMLPNGQILREWNNIQNKQGRYIHFRKFIRCNGSYLSHINGQVNSGPLYFWGEWEGNSIFYPVNSNGVPTGYHVPVHSTLIHGHQNTDPYVYGEGFKYAICRQDGIMQQLNQHDLILFGSNTKNGFYLDCVFVVNNFEPAPHVRQNKANNYTPVYSEETLDRLFEYLRKPHVPNHNIRYTKVLPMLNLQIISALFHAKKLMQILLKDYCLIANLFLCFLTNFKAIHSITSME